MSSPTTNFGWIKPTIFGNINTWGSPLNTNLDSQDSLIRRFMNNFIGTTAPTEAQAGTTWLDSTTNPYILKIYDGTDWITMGTLNTITNTFIPYTNVAVGDYKMSLLGTDHGGWLLCDGRSVSADTYSGLAGVVNYVFGGTGANFNLPDARCCVPGIIGTRPPLTTRTLDPNYVGAETVTLDITQMPAHNHSFTAASSLSTTAFPKRIPVTGASGDLYTNLIDSTGGGAAHNNMQPTLFIGNLFIYAGV